MFAIPPPPRYPTSNGLPPTPLETTNQISKPEGPEFTFQSGEGTYVLRDDLQLATPPPHPSETPVTNPNPLATSTHPPTAGSKLTLLTLNARQVRPQLNKTSTATSNLLRWRTLARTDTAKARDVKEAEKDVRLSSDAGSTTSANNESTLSTKSVTTPAFGEGNAALSLTISKDGLKKRKPKNNMMKSNSSFVSRVIPHDHLAKRLSERDRTGTFAFVNVNRAFQWLDLSSATKSEPLTKILFTKAHILCHDVNSLTKDESHLDIVMGSSASDLIWYEPISQKYARINKNGIINSSPVSKVKWIPGSENHFLAAHQDGTLVVYDKEKEDAPFVGEDVIDEAISIEDDSVMNITKSVNSANQKANPVACWKLTPSPINDFAFAPNNRHLAVVAEDGHLRVIDYLKETLTDVFSSYYGGFTCVTWSPDGKYILTGGQDDLVSIWSLADRQLIARCPGHDSWVTAVAFDPWRCDDKTYRFGSIGDDCKLLLWDFSVGMLHRPKGVLARARGSVSGQSVSLSRHRTESASLNRLRSGSNRSQPQPGTEDEEDEAEFVNHAIEPRSRTALLPPVMSKVVDPHPLSSLAFEQDCIITTCLEGHIRTWDRPVQNANASQIDVSAMKQ